MSTLPVLCMSLTCIWDCLLQALSNLLVLSREGAGAQKIFDGDGVTQLNRLLDEKDTELVLNSIRVLSSLAKNSKIRVQPPNSKPNNFDAITITSYSAMNNGLKRRNTNHTSL